MWFLLGHNPAEVAWLRERSGLPEHFIVVSLTDGNLAGTLERIANEYPDEASYGLVSKGSFPHPTDGPLAWWEKLEQTAGDRYLACSSVFDARDTPLGGIFVVGGELVRGMGGLTPCPGVAAKRLDNAIHAIAETFDIVRPIADVKIESNIWAPEVVDIADENIRFSTWFSSRARIELANQVGRHIGIELVQTDLSKVRLAICFAMGDCKMDIVFFNCLKASVELLTSYNVNPALLQNAGGSHVGKARERLLWQAMAVKEITHILFIDDDMGWDPKLPLHLIASGHEFAAAVGVKKGDGPPDFACNFLQGNVKFDERSGFMQIAEVGFAYVMLKRSVIEKMIAGYPELAYDGDGRTEYAFFLDMISTEPSGYRSRLSEDLSFCRRWREIGGEIWVDPTVGLDHIGRKAYTGRIVDTFKKVGKNGEPLELEAEPRREAAE